MSPSHSFLSSISFIIIFTSIALGHTRFEIYKVFESEYPFLGEKCSLEHCECEQIFCGIKDDIEVDAAKDSVNMDNISDQYDVADQYLHML